MYRISIEPINCSLADAAADLAYLYFLKAAVVSYPLHDTFVNTW